MAKPFKGFSRNQEWYPVMQSNGRVIWIGWRKPKGVRVIKKHDLSFEAVLVSIAYHGLGDVWIHDNVDKYPDQYIIQQKVSGTLCDVPCNMFKSEGNETCIFLQTIKDKPKKRAGG